MLQHFWPIKQLQTTLSNVFSNKYDITMKTTTSLSSSAWKKDRLKLCLTGTSHYVFLEASHRSQKT